MNVKRKLISIIVPAYKQEKTITRDLRRIKRVLDHLRQRFELICVVDGRVDKTYEKAKIFSTKFKNVKVIGYESNRGKGYAVRFGMAKSHGEIIGFIDAGMDIHPNGLAMLLEHFEWYKADIIVGSKRHPASYVEYSFQRRVLSICAQITTFTLFGFRIKDTQVGIKFFKREVLERVLPRLLVKAFAFDIEILAVAHFLGYKRIFEGPVEIIWDKKNTSVNVKAVMNTIIDMLAIFYRLKIIKYYSGSNKRRWRYDPELNFRINIG